MLYKPIYKQLKPTKYSASELICLGGRTCPPDYKKTIRAVLLGNVDEKDTSSTGTARSCGDSLKTDAKPFLAQVHKLP